jgi:hypothetical protein
MGFPRLLLISENQRKSAADFPVKKNLQAFPAHPFW